MSLRSRSRIAATLVATLSLLLAIAAPSFATDVVIGALDVVCEEGEGPTDYGIAFTIRTDRPDGPESEHPQIRVEYRPGGSSSWTLLATGALNAGNGYEFSSTVTGFDFTGLDTIEVRATAVGVADGGSNWGDGRLAGDRYQSTTAVDDCGFSDPGENAEASWTAGCPDSSEPAVFLKNAGAAGDADITFDVRGSVADRTFQKTVTLEPGATKRVDFVFTNDDGTPFETEDTTVVARVLIDGDVEFSRDIVVDCLRDELPTPDAAAGPACTEDGGAVEVESDNPTDAPVEFVVSIDGKVVDTFTLGAGESRTDSYPVGDGEHDVSVQADGADVSDSVVVVDCVEAAPVADATDVCDAVSGIVVTLDNPGDAPVEFEVVVDGSVVDTVVVPAGGTDTVTAGPLGDGDHDVVVTADGQTIVDRTINVDCSDDPIEVDVEAIAVGVCDEDGGLLVVDLVNEGDEPVDFSIVVDGVEVATETVTAGTETVEVPVAEGVLDVVVIGDGETLVDDTLEIDCTDVRNDVEERPLVGSSCDESIGSVTVELGPATDDQTYTIVVDGDEVASVDLALGDIRTVEVVTEDGDHLVEVFVGDKLLVAQTVTVDCTDVLGNQEGRNPAVDPGGAPAVSDGQLPNAGAAAMAWIVFALMLTFLGADLLLTQLSERWQTVRA